MIADNRLDMSTGTHSSPVYRVDFGNGGLWHYSSFYEHEHDDFVHHMRPASESSSQLEPRSAPNPYNTIRWGSGGFGKWKLKLQLPTHFPLTH